MKGFSGRKTKFKNIFGQACQQNQQFTNLKVNKSAAAAESTVISCSDEYMAVPFCTFFDTFSRVILLIFQYSWTTGGGGAVCVVRYEPRPNEKSFDRRLPVAPALIAGHKDFVLDLNFAPLLANQKENVGAVLATGSGDCTVKIWQIPYQIDPPKNPNAPIPCIALQNQITDPLLTLNGHDKKVHLVQFHSTAKNVLLSSSLDQTVKLWDLNTQKLRINLTQHTDLVQSVSWSYDGSSMASSCRDRQLRVFDPRTNTVIVQGEVNESTRGFRVQWLGTQDKFLTVGFNKSAQRQFSLWDLRKGIKRGPISESVIDQGPGQLFPFYDEANNLIYLAGKGDTSVKVYEIDGEAPYVHLLSEFKSNTTQTGLCMLPRRKLDVKKLEMARIMRLCGDNMIDSISFTLPRKPILDGNKQPVFHDDVYPPAITGETVLTSEEWFSGKDNIPKTKSLQPADMQALSVVNPQAFASTAEDDTSHNEEGQKSQNIRRHKRTESVLTPQQETELERELDQDSVGGWVYKLKSDGARWHKRYLQIYSSKEMVSFAHDKRQMTNRKKISFKDIISVEYCDSLEDDFFGEDRAQKKWFCITTANRIFHFVAEDIISCAQFVEGLHRKLKLTEEMYEDFLIELTVNDVGRVQGTKRRFVGIWKNMFHVFGNRKHSTPTFSLNLVNEVVNVENNAALAGIQREERDLCFRMNTKSKKIYFMALNQQQKDSWIEKLTYFIHVAQNANKPFELSAEAKTLQSLGFIKAVSTDANQEEPQGKVQAYPISQNLEAEDIIPLFSVFGNVLDLEVKREGKFKNYAIVTFEKMSEAQAALKLDKATLDTEIINVSLLSESETQDYHLLKITNISKEVTKLDFKNLFEVFGEIDLMQLFEDPKNKNYYMGYLKYVLKESAEQGVMLNQSKMFGSAIQVETITDATASDEDKYFLHSIDPNLVKSGEQRYLVEVRGGVKIDKNQLSVIRSKVIDVNSKHLNSNHSYILDCGKVVYQWNGKYSTRFNRARCLDISSNIRVKERQGTAKGYVLDEEKMETELKDAEQKKGWFDFFKELQINEHFCPSVEREDDEKWKQEIDDNTRVYRIGLTSQEANSVSLYADPPLEKPFQQIKVKLIHELSQPSKELLKEEYCYVVDIWSEIYIWEGSKVESLQRLFAKKLAMKLSHETHRPITTFVSKVIQSSETVIFKEKFFDFGGFLPIAMSAGDASQSKGNVAAKVDQPPVEELVQMMIQLLTCPNYDENTGPEELEGPIAKGQIQTMWKVEGYDKIPIDSTQFGQFYSGESYIILYKYVKNNKDKYMVYFYQGRDSSINEKGTSARLTVEVSDQVGSDTIQVRIVQQKETKHFLSMFPNGIIIHQGKQKSTEEKKLQMYDIRVMEDECAAPYSRLRAVELSHPHPQYLNKNHVFVVKTLNEAFVWLGSSCKKEEENLSNHLLQKALSFKGKITQVKQGSESDAFWKVFAGPSKPTSKAFLNQPTRIPRDLKLFYFSQATGAVIPDRVWNFTQDDLDIYSVYVLDCIDKIYFWFGSESQFIVQKLAVETLMAYIKEERSNMRRPKVEQMQKEMYIIHPGQEPYDFRRSFQAWSAYKQRYLKEIEANVKKQQPILPDDENNTSVQSAMVRLASFQRKTYSYQELLSEDLPEAVDKTKLEQYLSDDEFLQVFKMTLEEYNKLPDWKQKKLKTSVYLF